MTRIELSRKLDELNISKDFYSLEGNLLPDRMVLVQADFRWLVLYFDKEKSVHNLKSFDSENEACSYLYNYYKIR
jgi:hypothetical protein